MNTNTLILVVAFLVLVGVLVYFAGQTSCDVYGRIGSLTWCVSDKPSIR